jgi:hypothetical protein
MTSFRLVLLLLPLLAACDQLKERAGIHDPVKLEAEGKAIGAACRLSGRSLETCYGDNEDAVKAAVFAGWKEMNEYMLKNNMKEMPAEPTGGHAGEAGKAEGEAAKGEDKAAETAAEAKHDTGKKADKHAAEE